MKRYFKYITFAVVSLTVLGSCNHFLDKMPDQRTETDTPEKIAAILVSAYPTHMTHVILEKMSDNTADNGTRYGNQNISTEQAYLLRDITEIGNASPHSTWEAAYNAVTAANQALESIELLDDPSVCDPQKGEALLCRAYGHFVLAYTFCMPYNEQTRDTELGVPYAKEVEKTAINTYERGTLGQLYDNILDDVTKGVPLIRDEAYDQPKYHFNSKAANTFAAQINLFMGNFDEAIEYATAALQPNAASLMRDMGVFDAFTSRTEYYYQWINSDEPANYLLHVISSPGSAYGLIASAARYDMSGDITKNETIGSAGGWGNSLAAYGTLFGTDQTGWAFPKMDYIFAYTDRDAGVGYAYSSFTPFTSDKALLIRAEAYVWNGEYDRAAEDLSTYYRSVGGNSATAASLIEFYGDEEARPRICKPLNLVAPFLTNSADQKAMLQAVIHARRVAVCWEGLRLQDVKRFGIPFTHNVANGETIYVEPYDRRLVIQIPDAIRSAGIEGNPRQ